MARNNTIQQHGCAMLKNKAKDLKMALILFIIIAVLNVLGHLAISQTIIKLSKDKSLSEASIVHTLHFGQMNESTTLLTTLLTQQISQITINPSLPSQSQPQPPHPFQTQIPPRHTIHGQPMVLNLTLLFHFRFYLMVIWSILFTDYTISNI